MRDNGGFSLYRCHSDRREKCRRCRLPCEHAGPGVKVSLCFGSAATWGPAVTRKAIPELQGRPRRRLIAQVRREEPNCWGCGLPIDLTLDAQTHPMGSTVDETVPRNRAVDPRRAALTRSNLHHMHRRCNAEKGDRLAIEQRTSRDW